MMILLVLLCVQTDDQIAAFLKGDDAARAELVKLGVPAIAPLRQARDKGPEKIDALVYDIKKAAAFPKNPKLLKDLEAKQNYKLEDLKLEAALEEWQKLAGVNFMLDSFKHGDLKSDAVTVAKDDIPARDALDMICRQTGLDYGFFHNVLVLSKPARLWGEGKTKGAFGPPAPDRQHVAPEDQVPLEKVRRILINLDLKSADVQTAAMYMQMIAGINVTVDSAPKDTFSIRVKDLSMLDVLALITQCLDLDYVLVKGDVVIDTRPNIAKRVAGKK